MILIFSLKEEFSFNSYKTSLRFRSDSEITSTGFKILGEQIDCSYESSDQSKVYSTNKRPNYGQSSVQYTNDNTLTSSQSQSIPQPQPPQPRPSYSYPASIDPQSQYYDMRSPYSPPQHSPPKAMPPHQPNYYYGSPQPSSHSSQPKPFTTHVSPSSHSSSSSDPNYERRYSPPVTDSKSFPTQQMTNYEPKNHFTQNVEQSRRPYSPVQGFQSNSQSQSHSSQDFYQKPIHNYGNPELSPDSQKLYESPKHEESPYTEITHKTQTNEQINRCQELIQSMYFEIKSPKESNSECMYRIQKAKQNVCQLDILFSNFDLGDDNCVNQYMAVDGQRLCGSIDKNTMKTYKFENNNLMIELKAETMGFGKGFDIKARQVECSPPVDKNQPTYQYSEPNVQPIQPQLPTNNFRPVQPIRPDNQKSSYDNSLRSPPSHDFRQIPQTVSSKPVHQIQGIHSDPNRSDGRQLYGPELKDRSPVPLDSEERCHLIYSEIEFSIVSPNHPKPYPSNMLCRYTIRKANPNICAIDMKFKSFDIEDDPKCAKDFMEVDSGRICGPLPPSHESQSIIIKIIKLIILLYRKILFLTRRV